MYKRHIQSCSCECFLLVLCRKYFRVRPDRSLQWTLTEQSQDETGTHTHTTEVCDKICMGRVSTVQRLLRADEDPGEVVDFWGKSKVLNTTVHFSSDTTMITHCSLCTGSDAVCSQTVPQSCTHIKLHVLTPNLPHGTCCIYKTLSLAVNSSSLIIYLSYFIVTYKYCCMTT